MKPVKAVFAPYLLKNKVVAGEHKGLDKQLYGNASSTRYHEAFVIG